MKIYKITALLFILVIIPFQYGFNQVLDPVKWEFSSKVVSENEAVLYFTATIDEPWHIYAQDPNGGYNPTTFTFNLSGEYKPEGNVKDPGGFKRMHDELLETDYNLYSKTATFTQKININTDKPFKVSGNINYFSCDDKKCLPPVDEEFEISISPLIKKTAANEEKIKTNNVTETHEKDEMISSDPADTVKAEDTSNPAPVNDKKEKKGLIALIIQSFLGGLAALLTPCVYPIIPLTVSFFMRGNPTRRKSVATGILFGLSIIFIYTFIGLLMGLFRIDLTATMASSWIANVIFFIIFMVFAFSFFGMFELVLPSRWANSADAKADRGGIIGTFFMALATVIISFSCTGPIVGIIIGKSLQGELIQPVIGMFAFALAFSLPFPLLAVFPSMIKKLPRSGGWLNSIKVFFAFIMLAFSLKFVQNIDSVLHWGIISRELFLSFWIVLSFLLGLYLIGKLKFSHDSDIPYITVPRIMLSIFAFTFSVYLVTGLFGAELKGLSALLPVKKSNTTFLTASEVNADQELCGTPKYSDFLELPHGLKGYFDYEEGMACAKKINKPVLLDFKGHVCTNCKEMEQKVWSDPQVLKRLKENYIIIALYTDDRTKLPESKWYISDYDGKEKKTLGKQNLDMQITKFGTNSIPYYVLTDTDGNILVPPRGSDLNIEAYIEFLDEGVKNFKTN